MASTPSRGIYYDGAYAPYGENYAESGTTDRSFTGQDQAMVSSGSYPLYDFLMREYNATWGRWISPDPAGLAAVNPANPQTWNRYAYVGNNPLSFTDPQGLLTTSCAYGETGDICNQPPPPTTAYDCSSPFAAETNAACSGIFLDFAGEGWNPDGFCSDFSYFCNSGGGAAKPPSAETAPNGTKPCPVSAASINEFLASKDSPMAGQGQNFFNAGEKYNVDPRLIVALSGAETSFGKDITWGQYNAWNWGWNASNRSNSPFSSWAAGISAVSEGIHAGYLQARPPLTTAGAIYSKYCQGADCTNGLQNLNTFLTQQGGNPNALQFPCP